MGDWKDIPEEQRIYFQAQGYTPQLALEMIDNMKLNNLEVLIDLGGKPSNDNRTASERNEDYWRPIKGYRERIRSANETETSPFIGIKKTIVPAASIATFNPKTVWNIGKAFVKNPILQGTTMAVGLPVGIGLNKLGELLDWAIAGNSGALDAVGDLYGTGVAKQIINPSSRATHFYKNFSPFGYNASPTGQTTKLKLKDVAKSMAKGYEANTDATPDYLYREAETMPNVGDQFIGVLIPGKARVMFRDAAYRKYLGLKDRSQNPVYIDNGDGTFSYNMPYVNRRRVTLGGEEFDPSKVRPSMDKDGNISGTGDFVTGNGGYVSWLDNADHYRILDIWDLLPFKDINRSPLRNFQEKLNKHFPKLGKKFANQEVGPFMNGKPFKLDLTYDKVIYDTEDPYNGTF